jgi:hypothetical protein
VRAFQEEKLVYVKMLLYAEAEGYYEGLKGPERFDNRNKNRNVLKLRGRVFFRVKEVDVAELI